MDDSKVQFIGNPCGHHGPYTFYKAFKFNRDDKCRILTLGEFFFVKIFSEAPVCISELQLLWEDKNNSQLLSSVRLYYLPEHTPDGPQEHHGQDEVLAVSEKIILRVEDLVELIRDGVSWDRGSVPFTDISYNHQQSRNLAKSFAANNFGLHFKGERKNENTGCEESSSTQVTILSFPRYCRYRAVLKRLEKCEDKWLHNALVCAIGGFTVKNANSRVVFCRDTFDAPDLDTLDIRCDHLAPNLKGRPRKKRARSKKDSQDSDSCESNGDLFLPSGGSQSKPSPVTAGRTRKDSQKNGSLLPDRKDITQEEQAFLHSLHKYMKSRKTPIERIPSLGFKQIDIYVFYTFAQKLGGYDQITQKRLWKHLYDQLGGNPGSTSAATCTRRHYEKLLLPYERYKNGEEHVPLESVASDSDKSENQDDLAPICDGKSPEEGEPTPIRDKVNTEGTKRGNSPSSDSQESKVCSKDSPRPVLTEQSVNQKVEVVSGSKADRCNVVLSADKFAESRPKLLEMKNRNKISILSPITAHKPLSHPSSPYHSPYVPHHYQKSSALQTVSKPHSAHTPFLTPTRSLPVSASSAVSIKSGSKDEAYIKHLNSLSQHSRSGEVLRTAHQKDSTSIHRPSVIQHTPKIKPAHQNSAHDKPAVTLEPRKAASHTAHLNPPRQALPAHSNHLKRNYPAYLENTGLGHPVHRVPPYEYSSGRSRQVSQPLVSSLKRPRLQDPSSPHYYLAQMRSLAGDFNKKQPGVTENRPRLPKPSHQPPPPPKYTHTDEQPTDLSVKKNPEIKASVGIDLSKKRNTTPQRECSPQHYRSSPSETYRQPVSHRPAHNSPSPVPAHIKSTHPSCSQLSPSPYKSQRSDTDRRTPGPYATTPELAMAAKTFPMESSHLLHPAFPHTYMSPTMVPRGIVNFSPHSVHNMFEAHMRANVAQAAAYEELVKRNMSRVQGTASPSSSTVPGQTKYSGSTTRQPYPH